MRFISFGRPRDLPSLHSIHLSSSSVNLYIRPADKCIYKHLHHSSAAPCVLIGRRNRRVSFRFPKTLQLSNTNNKYSPPQQLYLCEQHTRLSAERELRTSGWHWCRVVSAIVVASVVPRPGSTRLLDNRLRHRRGRRRRTRDGML